jgi:hypothetical protein
LRFRGGENIIPSLARHRAFDVPFDPLRYAYANMKTS